MTVRIEKSGFVTTIVLSRHKLRNAVDRATAFALARAFESFEKDDSARVAVLWGEGGTFSSGADLKAFSEGEGNRLEKDGDAPMGPTRMMLSKPAIAAIEGHAVAGGLELALMCDLRVAARGVTLGVFCRRFGVPLIDGGTVRLPRIIGHGRALDLILTGRAVGAEEAYAMGLVNRIVENGDARRAAEALASELAALPNACMLGDRRSAYEQWGRSFDHALAREFEIGMESIASGEGEAGALRFASGSGRHGKPE